MALIFKAKDANFSNYIAVFSPPDTPDYWYDFGVDEATSISNKSGGSNLSVFDGSGIIYNSKNVLLPQDSSSADFYRLSGVSASAFTAATHGDAGSTFERIVTSPLTSTVGLLVDSNGDIAASVLMGDGSANSVATQLLSRPYAATMTVDEDSGANTVSVRLDIKYDDGSTASFSDTFSGTLDAAYDSLDIDIGRSSSGGFVASELVVYERALTPVEIGDLNNYLLRKYV